MSRAPARASRRITLTLGAVLVVGIVTLTTAAAAAPAPPGFSAPVVDAARVVPDGVERTVDRALEDYRRRSGRQVAVAVITTTGTRSLEDYTIDLARAWGVGTRGRDDGVLLLIAVADRRVRLEVGRGAEARLTDLEAGRIIRERLVPLLAAGRYGAAVQQGTDAVRVALGDRQVGTLPPPPAATAPRQATGPVLFVPLLLGVVFLLSLLGRRRRRRRWGGVGVPIIWGGGLGGGLGSGGLGGGGLGGGFGGGGGGGFGGGGASGSW